MIPQFPEFKKLELSDKNEIETFIKCFPPYSDFSFTSMWCWDTCGDMRISIYGKNLIVRFSDYLTKKPRYSFIGESLSNEIAKDLLEYSRIFAGEAKLFLVPGIPAAYLNADIFVVSPDRDAFDYIYDVRDLAQCQGSKYEQHRALVRRFDKNYPDVEIKTFNNCSEIKEEILNLEKIWQGNKAGQSGAAQSENESVALRRIMELQDVELSIFCLFQNQKLIAFCISEIVHDGTWSIGHFGKADISYLGIYQFLFKKKAEYEASRGIAYFNYEQDLGIEGLRLSKTKLRPVGFLKKFTVSLQSDN